MSKNESEDYMNELEALRTEHHDLDDAIARLADNPHVDDFELKRMKKRKLHLKDQIALLEGKVTQDASA
jgi:hypothetical protein